MKIIKTFVLLLLINITAHSQEKGYLKIPELDKFVGTWAYDMDGKSFTITLKKIEFIHSSGGGMDIIRGTHTYRKDNVVIDSTISKGLTVTSGSLDRKNENVLLFNFRDGKSTIYSKGSMTYKKGSPDTIIWNIEKGHNRYGSPPKSFEMPLFMEMKKIIK